MRWAISIGPAGRQLLSSTDRTPRGGGRRVWLPRAPSSAFLLVLREAPLARGREWHYSLDAHPLAEVYREWLESFAPCWEESLERLKRQVEDGED